VKILFDGIDFASRSGPNTFGGRIAKSLANRGHTIADPVDYDISLTFIEPTNRSNPRKPFVQRLDGVWFSPREFLHKNVGIKSAYHQANSVIFQSQFNATQVTKWWGQPKSFTVISNGIDLIEVDAALKAPHSATTVDLTPIRQMYDKIFVASSNWHNQKRLRSNYEMFAHLRRSFYPRSCLIVMGSTPTKCHIRECEPHVFFTGNVTHQACLQMYHQADYMLHLAWLDHCPNVVVEAIACGLPVIHSFDGGTKEIVRDWGVALNEQRPYEYSLEDYDNPPLIDVTQVAVPLPAFDRINVERQRINIDNVTLAYEKVLQDAVQLTA
jgi:glycosyltransferase involved in cell wall biosynthesis